MVGFDVDGDFIDVLDALVTVDLRDTQSKVMERYLGTEGTRSFLAFHGRGGGIYARAS